MDKKDNSIDLSKVSNLEASGDEQLIKKAKMASNGRKKSKFNFNLETERVQLPSGGKLYQTDDEVIKSGFIDLYPMTVKEEEILSTQRFLKKGVATRMVFENCIASNIDAKDLLSYDSTYILFALRQISYGDEYTFTKKCSNDSCGKEFKHTIKISELEFNELPDDIEEPIELTLPKTKYNVSLILPRVFHTEQIQMMREKRKDATTGDRETILIDQLLVTTLSITSPDGDEVPQKDWKDFYEEIPSFDRAHISDAVRFNVGIDELEDVECPYCGTEQGGNIPIGIEFFRL